MIEFTQKGDFSKTNNFLERALNVVKLGNLDRYGREGVEVLSANTPKDTGKTASSWYYRINRSKNSVQLQWCNSNMTDGIPIAILIQYGHGLQNGAFLEGEDFINPSIRPIFNEIANNIGKELSK